MVILGQGISLSWARVWAFGLNLCLCSDSERWRSSGASRCVWWSDQESGLHCDPRRPAVQARLGGDALRSRADGGDDDCDLDGDVRAYEWAHFAWQPVLHRGVEGAGVCRQGLNPVWLLSLQIYSHWCCLLTAYTQGVRGSVHFPIDIRKILRPGWCDNPMMPGWYQRDTQALILRIGQEYYIVNPFRLLVILFKLVL